MSYRRYNTGRFSGYNTPGTFVSSGNHLHGLQSKDTTNMRSASPLLKTSFRKPVHQDQSYSMNENNEMSSIQPPLPPLPPLPPSNFTIDNNGSELSSDGNNETFARPHWMKPKVQGMKKIPNKERRRRQNENLRRLLTPKNALMVLNEIVPGEQVANQFKVEARPPTNVQYYKPNLQSFSAELTFRGVTYKGLGETKMIARNQAAEQAIRDIMLQRMTRFIQQQQQQSHEQHKLEHNNELEAMSDSVDDTECAMPMIQLCSYALHKLFSEWEYEGHKVPQLRPNICASSASETGSEPDSMRVVKVAKVPKIKEIPYHAARMHPSMLLSYMRTGFEYREVEVGNPCQFGTRFTMAIDIDGQTFTATATSKREARKLAAKAACEQLFNITFEF